MTREELQAVEQALEDGIRMREFMLGAQVDGEHPRQLTVNIRAALAIVHRALAEPEPEPATETEFERYSRKLVLGETEPAGEWRMVPVEPTGDMRIAGGEAQQGSCGSYGEPAVVYRAMLAASPTPPQTGWEAGAEAMRDYLTKFCQDNSTVRGVHGAKQAPYWRACLEAIMDAELPSPPDPGGRT